MRNAIRIVEDSDLKVVGICSRRALAKMRRSSAKVRVLIKAARRLRLESAGLRVDAERADREMPKPNTQEA
ncbi:hypothetical protein [Capsulimonas corticalis]|nr:hypothetical protein [Capsulimonas corticalis]